MLEVLSAIGAQKTEWLFAKGKKNLHHEWSFKQVKKDEKHIYWWFHGQNFPVRKGYYFFFKKKNLIFLLLFPQYNFFLLYSMITQLHIHVYILFSPIIMVHLKWLNIVLSATQQNLIANLFQKQ